MSASQSQPRWDDRRRETPRNQTVDAERDRAHRPYRRALLVAWVLAAAATFVLTILGAPAETTGGATAASWATAWAPVAKFVFAATALAWLALLVASRREPEGGYWP